MLICIFYYYTVVVGEGAILETVGNFNNLRYSNTSKGQLATVSSENPCFECHIRLDCIKKVKFVEVTKEEGKVLRIIRFQDGDKALLSAIMADSSSSTNWFANAKYIIIRKYTYFNSKYVYLYTGKNLRMLMETQFISPSLLNF